MGEYHLTPLRDTIVGSRVHVFVQLYAPTELSRHREIETCLEQNLRNPHLHHLHLWLEDERAETLLMTVLKRNPQCASVHPSRLPRRLTYADWLQATNELPVGDISLLVNSDIALDETLALLPPQAALLEQQRIFLAISRYQAEGAGWVLNPAPHWTQDTWGLVRGETALSGPLLQETNFQLGIPGCDNKIAYVMHSYGYVISNPCHVLRTRHHHAAVDRNYDPRADKLAGLHAFVHPVAALSAPSALEFQLLSRATQNPSRVVEANWLVGRVDRVWHAFADNDATKLTFQPALDVAPASIRPPAGWPARLLRHTVAPLSGEALSRIESFSVRYHTVSDGQYLYFIDNGWPYWQRLLQTELPPQFESWPAHRRFALGFLPPLLPLTPFEPRTAPGHVDDVNFWQHPCRTEQSAAQMVGGRQGFSADTEGYATFLGVPWATFIDLTHIHGHASPQTARIAQLLDILANRLDAVRDYLRSHGLKLRVHTVCQHILWRQAMPWFKQLGMSDLWLSHKQGGVDIAEGIRLHPWHLHAVNVLEPGRQVDLEFKSLERRQIFASFVGAQMSHYLSETRRELVTRLTQPDYVVVLRNEWHFNRMVYEQQIHGAPAAMESPEAQAMAYYNRTLSDSRFSLCPAGAGPNTLRLWESLAIGCVPVVLSDTCELPNLHSLAPGLGLSWDDVVVRHPETALAHLDNHLRAIPDTVLERMQALGRDVFFALQAYSPVEAGITASANSEPPSRETLSWFKPQQFQHAVAQESVVDGVVARRPAWMVLDAGETELVLHFDKPETLLAVRVVRSGNQTASVQLTLGLAERFNHFITALDVAVPAGHGWIDVPKDHRGLPRCAESLRLQCSTEARGVVLRFEFDVVPDALARGLANADATGQLGRARYHASLAGQYPFDGDNLHNGRILDMLAGATADFPCTAQDRLFPRRPPSPCNLFGEKITDGLSLFVCVKNRNAHIRNNLANWLAQTIDELIFLDWSSDEPVSSLPDLLVDPRVRVIRVPDQTRYVRTWAQNLAARCARHAQLLKLDADVALTPDFVFSHPLGPDEFWTGEWRQGRDENERHLNGNVLAWREDFLQINGYDERIVNYGHDDTDFVWRMVMSGKRKRVFCYNTMRHQAHGDASRVHHLEGAPHPEVLTYYHRLLARERALWSAHEAPVFRVVSKSGVKQIWEISVESSYTPEESAELMAVARRTVASWYGPRGNPTVWSEDTIEGILREAFVASSRRTGVPEVGSDVGTILHN